MMALVLLPHSCPPELAGPPLSPAHADLPLGASWDGSSCYGGTLMVIFFLTQNQVVNLLLEGERGAPRTGCPTILCSAVHGPCYASAELNPEPPTRYLTMLSMVAWFAHPCGLAVKTISPSIQFGGFGS